MKQTLPFTDSKRGSLTATLKLVSICSKGMLEAERNARRAATRGAQNAARQFYLQSSVNAEAMEYYLKMAAQHAASGKALYQTL